MFYTNNRTGRSIGLVFLICSGLLSSCKSISINQKNFPDDAFRAAICCYLDVSEGEAVSKETLESIEYLDLSQLDIESLKGIEYFKGIEDLYCGDNLLTEVSFAKNPALKAVELIGNRLEKLDVTHNPSLVRLGCSYNRLSSIDVSKNPKLSVLLANANPSLEHIDVSHNPLLRVLGVNNCRLMDLDVSDNPELESLYCMRNKFTELDLTHNDKMKNLVYESPMFGKLRIDRPEGKPDLGNNKYSIWENELTFFKNEGSSMSEKHLQLTKGKMHVNHVVPYDSLEFETGMRVIGEMLDDFSGITALTPADTVKYQEIIDKYDSYPEAVFLPNFQDSLTCSQRIRLYQSFIAVIDEYTRSYSMIDAWANNVGLFGMEGLGDYEKEDIFEMISQFRTELEEEIKRLKI